MLDLKVKAPVTQTRTDKLGTTNTMHAFVTALPLTQQRSTLHRQIQNRHLRSFPPVVPSNRSVRVTPQCTSYTGNSQMREMQEEVETSLKPGSGRRIEIDGRELSYDYAVGTTPTVVFLPGYYFSRWRQAKANILKIFAKRKGQSFLVEEYLGAGQTDAVFAKDGSLSHWISDTCELVDRIPGKVILVGAGVGGWIMLHVAMQRPEKVVGLVGINPSLDFTHDLIMPSLTDEQNEEMEKAGTVTMRWGFREYPISKLLLDDAKKWLVLRGGTDSLDIKCPIRLLQGLDDEEIPADRILKLVDAVKSKDCIVSFIKLGDHFLEDESDMRRMWECVCELSSDYYEYDLTSPGSG